MINNIRIRSFKSFPDLKIQIKPLTILTGLNNSGKSTIIQSLRMHCNSIHENNPYLQGLGLYEELHSKFSHPKKPIIIACYYDDQSKEYLIINETKIKCPRRAPICTYIGADRLGPMTTLPLFVSANSYPHIGDKGEYVFDYIDRLKNIIIPERLHHINSEGSNFEFEIRGWLNEIAHGVKFRNEIDKKRDSSHAEINTFRPANVGFGISYTLPIIAAILGASGRFIDNNDENKWVKKWEDAKDKFGTLVMIENPEAHLHPKGQTAIGKMIALAAASGVQIILETHSDHLIDGIRIAVKEGLLDAKYTIFHFLSKQNDEKSSIVSPKLSEDGKIEFWPENFFDQTLKNRAILARRK